MFTPCLHCTHTALYPQQNSIASVSLGTPRDFVWGFILGFFVGFFLLFWVWMPTVSHRQKLGILAGIGVQLLLTQSQVDVHS